MSHSTKTENSFYQFITTLWHALIGKEADYTAISIRKAIFLLAIPMMLEMFFESVFAIVDLYFVGHLPNSGEAMQTVGLTESVLTIIYSLAIGMSMAATAVVARRIGEKDPTAAAKAGMQTIIVAMFVNVIISITGFIFAKELLMVMGETEATAAHGVNFVRIMMGSSTVIMLLFLINGIFRGAGNASIAMQSLFIANIANCILCPLFIRGFGPIPAFGLTGAAMATAIGRGIGVSYQIFHLVRGNSALKIKISYFKPHWEQIKDIIKIAAPAILQFMVASCSWIFLSQLVAKTGGANASAGYQTALRLMMFFLLPAWGLSNAAATLVGQNMGAKQLDKAQESVYVTMKYTAIFMGTVTAIFLLLGPAIVSFFTINDEVKAVAVTALRTLSYGFILYGVGMVLISAINGAGDTITPTWINVIAFWAFQIPFAYFLAKYMGLGPSGVFYAIPVTEVGITIAALILFRRGKWKTKVV
jgi:putative MATE family efflux protein